MYMVATESYLDFTSVPVKVGVKTGTTTVEKTINGGVYELNNGFIIGFAPFEDPEIAVAVAIEFAGMSAYLAPILAEIITSPRRMLQRQVRLKIHSLADWRK